MKQKNGAFLFYSLCAYSVIALNTSALAQSSTKISIPSGPAESNTSGSSTATITTPAKKDAVSIGAGYTGLFFGPGLEFNGKTKGDDALYINHRPKVKVNLGENVDLGVQPRFDQKFMKDGMKFEGGASRAFADFKNIIKTETTSLTITPRAILPFSSKAHNSHMLFAPEILVGYEINPKNSRFSLALTPELIKWVYADQETAIREKGNNLDFTMNIEGSYTLTPKTQLTFAFYPEWTSTAITKITSSGNEVDLGVSVEFLPGWTVNPLLIIENNGLQAQNASKNMGFTLVVNGAFI